MKLFNKETHYECVKQGNNLKIRGICSIKNNLTLVFSGNFDTLEDEYCGDFVFYEAEIGKYSISTNNISPEIALDAYKLILDTIPELRSKLTSFNQD